MMMMDRSRAKCVACLESEAKLLLKPLRTVFSQSIRNRNQLLEVLSQIFLVNKVMVPRIIRPILS